MLISFVIFLILTLFVFALYLFDFKPMSVLLIHPSKKRGIGEAKECRDQRVWMWSKMRVVIVSRWWECRWAYSHRIADNTEQQPHFVGSPTISANFAALVCVCMLFNCSFFCQYYKVYGVLLLCNFFTWLIALQLERIIDMSVLFNTSVFRSGWTCHTYLTLGLYKERADEILWPHVCVRVRVGILHIFLFMGPTLSEPLLWPV